jgi:hypothetical protein
MAAQSRTTSARASLRSTMVTKRRLDRSSRAGVEAAALSSAPLLAAMSPEAQQQLGGFLAWGSPCAVDKRRLPGSVQRPFQASLQSTRGLNSQSVGHLNERQRAGRNNFCSANQVMTMTRQGRFNREEGFVHKKAQALKHIRNLRTTARIV